MCRWVEWFSKFSSFKYSNHRDLKKSISLDLKNPSFYFKNKILYNNHEHIHTKIPQNSSKWKYQKAKTTYCSALYGVFSSVTYGIHTNIIFYSWAALVPLIRTLKMDDIFNKFKSFWNRYLLLLNIYNTDRKNCTKF